MAFSLDQLTSYTIVLVTLCVHYTDTYPDALPDLSLKHEDPNIDESDAEKLLTELRTVVGTLLLFSTH
jgi:hypothetical protein